MAISITKPTVGGSEGTWGATINTALDTIVDAANGTTGTIAPDLTKLTINGTDVTTSAADLTNAIAGFVLEDGDGTEVTVTGGKEVKFVEGGGVDINWTDTSTGSDADPYDLTFTLNADMRQSSNVDVYVGNTADEIHFDTDVGIRFSTAGAEDMRLTDGGDLHVDGDVIGFSTTISDQRLKHDINKIDNALDKVSQINGYTFTYNDGGKHSAGVIAQEIQNVLPSAVESKKLAFSGQDDVEYKTVHYDQLHGLLIEAIKELKAEIEELKNGGTK
jgi:hypothetical protein|tara:strand:- start:13504 stop:14328 length:825 start_codon:yes stop_codon:yes gene_type:complete